MARRSKQASSERFMQEKLLIMIFRRWRRGGKATKLKFGKGASTLRIVFHFKLVPRSAVLCSREVAVKRLTNREIFSISTMALCAAGWREKVESMFGPCKKKVSPVSNKIPIFIQLSCDIYDFSSWPESIKKLPTALTR